MKIKIGSAVILFLSILLLGSCEGDQTVKFRFTGLDLDHVNSAPGIPVIAHDSVPKKLYGIRLYLYPEETYRKGRYFDAYEAPPINENPISLLKVWSNADFNGTPAGTSLNNHFILFQGSYLHMDTLQVGCTIDPTAKYHDDFEKNNFPDYVDLLLLHQPVNGNYKFYVQLTFTNGWMVTDSTTTVKLY